MPEQEEIYQAAFSDKKAETVKIIDVTGVGEGAVFLLRGRANILFEAGMAYAADAMIEKIKQELQGEPPRGAFIPFPLRPCGRTAGSEKGVA